MAQNIAPSLDRSDDEISGLLNWSLPFAIVTTLMSLLVASLRLLELGSKAYLPLSSLIGVWHLLQTLAFIWHGQQSFSFFKSAKAFVNSGKQQFLGEAMGRLGNIWNAYAVILFCSLMGAITLVLDKNRTISQTVSVSVLVSFLLTMILSMNLEKRRSFAGEKFKKELPPFALLSVRRTRSLAFLSLGVGAIFIILYIFDFFPTSPLSSVASLFCGLGYLLMGVFMGFYWRALREIQRNPSWIYFERTLEKLNFYWLVVSCVGFPLIFISNII